MYYEQKQFIFNHGEKYNMHNQFIFKENKK